MAKYKLKKRLKRYNTQIPSKEDYELRDEIRRRVSEYHKKDEQTLEGLFHACYGAQIENLLKSKPRLLPDDKESK